MVCSSRFSGRPLREDQIESPAARQVPPIRKNAVLEIRCSFFEDTQRSRDIKLTVVASFTVACISRLAYRLLHYLGYLQYLAGLYALLNSHRLGDPLYTNIRSMSTCALHPK